MATKLKPKYTEKVIKFDIVPFHYDLKVVVSSDINEARTRRNDELGYYPPNVTYAALHCYAPDGYTSYIFLPYGACIGTIAHEVFHFVWRLMDYVGAEHNNEVMAYHVGHYVREIAKFVYTQSVGKKIRAGVKRLNMSAKKSK